MKIEENVLTADDSAAVSSAAAERQAAIAAMAASYNVAYRAAHDPGFELSEAIRDFEKMTSLLEKYLDKSVKILNHKWDPERADKCQNIRRVLVDFGVLDKSSL